jgi:hypothetical protein
MLEEARQAFNNDFFMEIFIIGALQIWKERNNLVFNWAIPSFRTWKIGFLDKAVLQSNRLRDDKRALFLSWLALYR